MKNCKTTLQQLTMLAFLFVATEPGFAQENWWDNYYGQQIGNSFVLLSASETFRGGTYIAPENTFHWTYVGSDLIDLHNGFNVQTEQYLGASQWIPINGNQNPGGQDTTVIGLIGQTTLYGLGSSNSNLTSGFATGWTPDTNSPFAGALDLGEVGILVHGRELNGCVLIGAFTNGVAGILTPGEFIQPLHGNIPVAATYISHDLQRIAGGSQNALWTKTGPEWDNFTLFGNGHFDTSGFFGLPGEWDAIDEVSQGSNIRIAIGQTLDINTFDNVTVAFVSNTGEQWRVSPGGLTLDAVGYQQNAQNGELELFGALWDSFQLDSLLVNFNTLTTGYWEQIHGSKGRVLDLEPESNIVVWREAGGSLLGGRFTGMEKILLGDVNLDGDVNLLDVAPFIDLLSSGVFQAEADINQDGVVNLLDVQPFVDLLTG